ncbi:MAG TPA: hypothetical protein VIA08_03505 [Nitrososphaeraceae archaeon]|jgi:hypothetical protein
MAYYMLVTVNQDLARYQNLVQRYWDWIFTENCDANKKFKDITFLRDDCFGDPITLVAGFDTSLPEKYNKQEIEISEGTDIFFPVYHAHICDVDPLVNGDINNCGKVADNDLANVFHKWATIKINNGQPADITPNFSDHEIKVGPFKQKVNRDNDIRKEVGLYLKPGEYTCVAHGTYILMKNLQKATYQLDFGGLATNFRTRSIYNMTVS